MVKVVFTSITLSFLNFSLLGQIITAQLIDSLSKEPVPLAHLYASQSNFGTVSNELGEFEISLNADNDTLLISHISYESKKIPRSELLKENGLILLTPLSVVLDEVVVTDVPVNDIVEDVLQQLRNDPTRYAKAFYRQIAFRDTVATEWIESFYKIGYSINGVDKLKIDQARFARKIDTINAIFNFINFSYLTLGNSIYSPKTNELENKIGKPFSEDFTAHYNFYLEEQYATKQGTYMKIGFEPNNKIETPVSIYGYFIYNKTKGRLVKYSGEINHSLGANELEYEGTKKLEIRNPLYSFNFKFSETKNVVEYITVNYTYELIQDGRVFPSGVSSKFIIYQNLRKKPRKLREPGVELEYVSNFEKAKYKPKFWRDNPAIKRTSKEEAIIATFEKENAFGSYFK